MREISSTEKEKIRINKYLSMHGVCSRREADRMIEEGKVTVGNRVCLPGTKVSDTDDVRICGKPIKRKDPPVLLRFYKPAGIVCSTKKQFDETTVTEYIKYPYRIYPIGRLDKESEGLLLLTNQGDIVNNILKASAYHEKEYIVTVDKDVTDEFLRRMSEGVPILGTVTRKCVTERTGKRSFRIVLTQGLNRQIRRMCEYLGFKVVRLKRIRIMEYTLNGLKPGEFETVPIPGELQEQKDGH